ncbi:Heavy metal-associated isoprenylated plant protein 26 [Carex littledalei]|uniref:Heavy metal-associated isoprenylated plant protein 26 n=1 Tax=Carex littledalei TaxID=544730 RepID=A0A833R254_9POAL|nr:Heavy metal-associated isoprenylated plant protein 26 [Carex littledalei]
MAKAEEELQRVDIRVNVNCCDGCKRKVKKALDIKGVLRTEIHQSLPKVTVIGNFDVRILLKRLAKVGKTAEIIPADETKKQQKEETKKSYDTSEKEKTKDEESPKDKSKLKDPEKSKETKNGDKDDIKPKNKEDSEEAKENNYGDSICSPIVAAIPNYTINPSIVSSNAPPMYYQMVPMPLHSMINPYSMPIPYGYRENGYYEAPLNRHIPPPPVHSQATVFTEYFNEDNTASCHVM